MEEEIIKYKFINKNKILRVSPLMEKMEELYVYANEQDTQFKKLVIEEKPTYNPETQELYSWFENGEVITRKFRVIEKNDEN